MKGLWGRGTRLLVTATAAWTTFLLLHVLLVGRWWPWFIFEATPPLAVVTVPLFFLSLVPFARQMRCRLSVVLVLVLLSGTQLAGYGPACADTATGGPGGSTVKVFAWNTDYWEMVNDEDAFYAFLRQQDADIYLLQEYVYRRGEPLRIDESARLRTEFPGYQMSVEGELVTLSRLPIVAAYHHPVPGTGMEWFRKGTKAQRTDIRVGGRVVSFYNVHLPVPFRISGNPLSGGFYRALKEQGVWRLRELRKLRADLAGNPHAAVLAGDFNSPWMELSPPGADIRVHVPTGSLAPPGTWPAADYPLPRLWRLDWLFTTGDLTALDYRLGSGGEAFSDHAAQVFRVVVPDDQKGRVT
ncbi:endonuclease/exonuclease/phosphatase family protein [Plantactinospora sp. CA-294935]|uniref:endonuclease/exonuclease/phosphatase family protein n=1 Tax=Plantactinospora sp. CA-294935 TaxID=3240012 RepID=UPI003D94AF85